MVTQLKLYPVNNNKPKQYVDPSGQTYEEYIGIYGGQVGGGGDGGDGGSGGKGGGGNNRKKIIVVKGSITIKADYPVFTDETSLEPAEGNHVSPGSPSITGNAQGLAAVNMYLYYCSYTNTYEVEQTIDFIAIANYDPQTGNARFDLEIISTFPEYFCYDPVLTTEYSFATIKTPVSMHQPNQSFFEYTETVPSSEQLGFSSNNHNPRSDYLSKATINLNIIYNRGSYSPKGILIDFNRGNYNMY